MKPFHFSVDEINLIVEALDRRATRLDGLARAHPPSAGPNERKAQRMRQLAKKMLQEAPVAPAKRSAA